MKNCNHFFHINCIDNQQTTIHVLMVNPVRMTSTSAEGCGGLYEERGRGSHGFFVMESCVSIQ